MSMDYIRKTYDVPAKRGGRVEYTTSHGSKVTKGTITGARGGHLYIKLDGWNHSLRFHPTWNLKYLDEKDD